MCISVKINIDAVLFELLTDMIGFFYGQNGQQCLSFVDMIAIVNLSRITDYLTTSCHDGSLLSLGTLKVENMWCHKWL